MTWQPIDTAPQQTRVLIWDGAEINIGESRPYRWWLRFIPPYGFNKPTHWMALPEPPKQQEVR